MAKINLKKYYHKRLIIDTSVLIKAFIEEPGSKTVSEIIKMNYQKELTLLAPALIISEFLNVLTKSIKDPKKIKTAYKIFKKMDIGITEPDNEYVTYAIENVCKNQKTSYYDASYHALAKNMDATFITADKKFYDIMKHKGAIEYFC